MTQEDAIEERNFQSSFNSTISLSQSHLSFDRNKHPILVAIKKKCLQWLWSEHPKIVAAVSSHSFLILWIPHGRKSGWGVRQVYGFPMLENTWITFGRCTWISAFIPAKFEWCDLQIRRCRKRGRMCYKGDLACHGFAQRLFHYCVEGTHPS